MINFQYPDTRVNDHDNDKLITNKWGQNWTDRTRFYRIGYFSVLPSISSPNISRPAFFLPSPCFYDLYRRSRHSSRMSMSSFSTASRLYGAGEMEPRLTQQAPWWLQEKQNGERTCKVEWAKRETPPSYLLFPLVLFRPYSLGHVTDRRRHLAYTLLILN